MPNCERCGQEFSRANGLEKHLLRKKPCKKPIALIQRELETAGVVTESLEEFRDSSKKFNSSLSKKLRSDMGIYFTPKKVRSLLFEKLDELGVVPSTILEPSFGSGEFILDARHKYADAHIFGVEMNEALFKSVSCPNATLVNANFLDWSGTADLIIGNPPYFVMKDTNKHRLHGECMTGRANIYVLFLYKCLKEHLKDNGFLAFVIPTSLYNCSYYQPIRDYIYENMTIRYVETLNRPGFYQTGQETILIILQKGKYDDSYIYKAKTGTVYISPFYKELYGLTESTTSLAELGIGVKTGNVVWNQVKDKLSDTGTLLIYSSNIRGSKLTLGNLKGTKKQYVKDLKKPKLKGPVILVERGYGNSFSFDSTLVKLDEFYAENHLNVLYLKSGKLTDLERVVKSFQDKRSVQFIRWFLGNGSISSKDLEGVIPIY